MTNVEQVSAILGLIAGQKCEVVTTGDCRSSGRILGARYGADKWCSACMAAEALRLLTEARTT